MPSSDDASLLLLEAVPLECIQVIVKDVSAQEVTARLGREGAVQL